MTSHHHHRARCLILALALACLATSSCRTTQHPERRRQPEPAPGCPAISPLTENSWGLVWMGPESTECAAAAPDNPFYDPSRPTVLFIHGWQNGGVARGFHQTLYFYPGRFTDEATHASDPVDRSGLERGHLPLDSDGRRAGGARRGGQDLDDPGAPGDALAPRRRAPRGRGGRAGAHRGAVLRYTHKEALDRARRMATHLKAQGFEPGSKIAIISKNCAHFFITELAIWMAGYTTVALYPTLDADTVSSCSTTPTASWSSWASSTSGTT